MEKVVYPVIERVEDLYATGRRVEGGCVGPKDLGDFVKEGMETSCEFLLFKLGGCGGYIIIRYGPTPDPLAIVFDIGNGSTAVPGTRDGVVIDAGWGRIGWTATMRPLDTRIDGRP